MRKSLFAGLTIMLCLLLSAPAYAWGATKKTIHVTPDNATIYIDGSAVGEGTYTVKFDGDFVMVKLKAPSYIERTYKLRKDDPKKTILYQMHKDEALAASTGAIGMNGESESENDGLNMANRWFDVTCRKGLTGDQIWRRLMNIVVNNFEEVEVRDKGAGWIKTRWKNTVFRDSEQVVRTRMEVRMTFVDEDQVTYRVRLESQIKDDMECRGSSCFRKFDYLLNKYTPLISELQTSVGGGE